MAFDRDNFYGDSNVGPTRRWRYDTTDSIATVETAGYFTACRVELRVGDMVDVNFFSGASIVTQLSYIVTARATTVTVSRMSSGQSLGIVNVRDYGAVGDGVTNDTAAFQAAYAQITSRGGTVRIPPCADRYIVTADPFASIVSGRGGVTELEACVETSVQLVVPREHQVRGMGRGISPDSTGGPSGSVIRAAATFPNDGTAVVRLGHPTEYSHGARLVDLLVDGRGLTNVVGVTAPTIQELSGLERCFIFNCNTGLQLISDATKSGYNWFVHDLEIYLRTGATGWGVDALCRGGRNVLGRITVNSVSGSHIATAAGGYRFLGANLQATDLHVEHVPIGIQLGDTTAGIVTRSIIIDGISGWDGSGGMTSLVYVPTVGYTDNYELRALQMTAGVAFTTQMIINDATNSVAILALTNPNVSLHRHDLNVENSRRHVTSTAYQHDTTVTLASGANNDVDIKGAGTLKLTPNVDGTSTLTGMTGGVMGRRVRICNQHASASLTLKHNVTSSGDNRLMSMTGLDLVLATSEVAEAEYNLASTSILGNRWLVWKL